MKCPIDKTEMELGSLQALADWIYYSKGELKGRDSIKAYKCPKCVKVELTTEK